MRRIREIKIQGYGFRGYEGLFWHSGKFWFDGRELKKVYNNGSISILIYGSKKSIRQLRKVAFPCEIVIYNEPMLF